MSKITFSYLRKFNGAMGVLHFMQGAIMLWLGLTLSNIKDFKLPINTSYLKFDEIMQRLVLQTNEITRLPIATILASFLFLSALAHFIIVLPSVNKFYNKNLERGINYFRWFEYALSSSIMIALIAMFFGIYDLSSLILIIGLNATMNMLGLLMELHNQTTKQTSWISFWIGSFAGLIPWIVVLIHFFGSGEWGEIPWFVYLALGSYFIFFNLFPANMYLQYKKVGPWQDYLYGERAYIILSLVAKSILAWLVFGGTLQPV